MPIGARPGVYPVEVLNPTHAAIAGGPSVTCFQGAHFQGPTTPTLITSWAQFVSVFGGFFPQVIPATGFVTNYLPFAVYAFFANGGRNCYVSRVTGTGAATGTLVLVDRAGTPLPTLTVNALNSGVWGNQIYVQIITRDAGTVSGRASFDLIVRNGGTGDQYTVERWLDLSMTPTDQRYAPTIINSVNNGPGSLYISVVDQLSATAAPNNIPAVIAATALAGGVDGAAPSTAQKQTAIALHDTVVGTPMINLPGETTNAVLTTLINYADPALGGRGDVFCIIDSASGLTSATEITAAQALPASSYAATYWPWVNASDPSSTQQNATRLLPPGGFVAGLITSTDAKRGPFKAPAGLSAKLVSVFGLERALTNTDLDNLNNANVNAIRQIPGTGVAVMGARTLKLTAADRYVPIRRTLNFLKYALVDGLQWALFEPNDQVLWVAVTTSIAAFLGGYWQQGGLRGATAAQAFYVKCDAGNNTPQTIAAGQLNVEVGLAVQYPAEFIVVKIGQWEGGNSSVSEG